MYWVKLGLTIWIVSTLVFIACIHEYIHPWVSKIDIFIESQIALPKVALEIGALASIFYFIWYTL
jgi:hypothetical protein